MKKIISWINESFYTSPLSPACKMCSQGAKMVILVTGLCSAKCYYCPLSFKKGGKDRIFADEWELENENDTKKLTCEAEYIDATGAGITGGDPLIVWERVKKYITLLKDVFGSKFHIHLYTPGLKNTNSIDKLVSAGLDEIRFHPFFQNWKKMDKNPLKYTINNVLSTGVDVAFEIPVIPGMEQEIISLINWADENELNWINLNELEYSERNYELLNNKNFEVKNDLSAAVRGSQESAISILNIIKNNDIDIGIHYCSVSFKDGIQLKNRIKRRAQNIVKDHEVITNEGTLIKGAIYKSNSSLNQLYNFLKNQYNISEKYIFIDNEKGRIEIGMWILKKLYKDLSKKGYECYMVEEYPTADRLEIERFPLPF